MISIIASESFNWRKRTERLLSRARHSNDAQDTRTVLRRREVPFVTWATFSCFSLPRLYGAFGERADLFVIG